MLGCKIVNGIIMLRCVWLCTAVCMSVWSWVCVSGVWVGWIRPSYNTVKLCTGSRVTEEIEEVSVL